MRPTCYTTGQDPTNFAQARNLMLSFDIETEGLDPLNKKITVAAIYDMDSGQRKCFNFLTGGPDAPEAFMLCLDQATALCAFNGAKFDIPFIAVRFNVERERYEKWILKLFDYFQIAKLVFGSSCGLPATLKRNNFSPKSGSGLQAIQWALEENWEKLESYCQDDADLTWRLSVKDTVALPLYTGCIGYCIRNTDPSEPPFVFHAAQRYK